MLTVLPTVPPTLQQATADLYLHQTPGHSRVSLGQSLVGSLLLSSESWCTQSFVYALPDSVPQSCVSSGGSMVLWG